MPKDKRLQTVVISILVELRAGLGYPPYKADEIREKSGQWLPLLENHDPLDIALAFDHLKNTCDLSAINIGPYKIISTINTLKAANTSENRAEKTKASNPNELCPKCQDIGYVQKIKIINGRPVSGMAPCGCGLKKTINYTPGEIADPKIMELIKKRAAKMAMPTASWASDYTGQEDF